MNDGTKFNLTPPCGPFPPIPSLYELQILNTEFRSTDTDIPLDPYFPIAIDQNPAFFIWLADDIRVESGFLIEDNTFFDGEIKYITIVEDSNIYPYNNSENALPQYLYSLEY